MRLDIDNWRWAGVPWFIRTGKKLPATQTELRAVFREPPRLGFMEHGSHRRPEPNQFVVKLDPSTGVRLIIDAHRADAAGPEAVTLDVEFADQGGEAPTPYEVLLLDAMHGDSTRFTRQDGVEETWRIFQPLLDAATAGAPLRAGLAGVPRRPTGWSRASASGAARGCSHERTAQAASKSRNPSKALETRSARRARRSDAAERGDALAVPADRRLRVPL